MEYNMASRSKRPTSFIMMPFLIASIVALFIILIYALYIAYAECNNKRPLGFVAWIDSLFSETETTETTDAAETKTAEPGYYIIGALCLPTTGGFITGMQIDRSYASIHGITITTGGTTTGGITTGSIIRNGLATGGTTTGHSTTIGGMTIGGAIREYTFVDSQKPYNPFGALLGAVVYNAAVNGGVITGGVTTVGKTIGGVQHTSLNGVTTSPYTTDAVVIGGTTTDGRVVVITDPNKYDPHMIGTIYGGTTCGGVLARYMTKPKDGANRRVVDAGFPIESTIGGTVTDTVVVVNGENVGGVTTGSTITGCTVTGTTVTGGIATGGITIGGTTTGGCATAGTITGYKWNQRNFYDRNAENALKYMLCGAVLLDAVITGGRTLGGTTTGGVVSGGTVAGTPNADGVITNATITGATITGGTTKGGVTTVNVNAVVGGAAVPVGVTQSSVIVATAEKETLGTVKVNRTMGGVLAEYV
jgi:hypothetical protein